jgi:hypothetical protein
VVSVAAVWDSARIVRLMTGSTPLIQRARVTQRQPTKETQQPPQTRPNRCVCNSPDLSLTNHVHIHHASRSQTRLHNRTQVGVPIKNPLASTELWSNSCTSYKHLPAVRYRGCSWRVRKVCFRNFGQDVSWAWHCVAYLVYADTRFAQATSTSSLLVMLHTGHPAGRLAAA